MTEYLTKLFKHSCTMQTHTVGLHLRRKLTTKKPVKKQTKQYNCISTTFQCGIQICYTISVFINKIQYILYTVNKKSAQTLLEFPVNIYTEHDKNHKQKTQNHVIMHAFYTEIYQKSLWFSKIQFKLRFIVFLYSNKIC